MTIRDLKLPQDLAELGPMLSASFQYPENPEWSEQEDERESLVSDIASIARSWWMIRIGQVFIPAMRDLLPGKVWVEDGRIAGVVLVQRRGSSSDWLVSTVATLSLRTCASARILPPRWSVTHSVSRAPERDCLRAGAGWIGFHPGQGGQNCDPGCDRCEPASL